MSIWDFLITDADAYREFQGGCLYLSLDYPNTCCGASVTRHEDGDIFLLDRDSDLAKLQALALAGQQLRMPLSNVMVLAELLLPKLNEDPGTTELAGKLNKGLFQIMRIINNMADAERYYPEADFKMENTELSAFLKEVFSKAETALDREGIRIEITPLPHRVFSLVDRGGLERAIYNLISNAVKFAKADSCIHICAAHVGSQIRISVENEGDSIPEAVQSTLFHRYQREPAIEDSRFGLGLGMSLIRSVAAMHGGTVLLDQPGGTRVTMTLTIRKRLPGSLRSPALPIGDYAGGWDTALLEFAETLPSSAYEDIF